MQGRFSHNKKTLSTIVLSVFLLLSIGSGFLLSPHSAKAAATWPPTLVITATKAAISTDSAISGGQAGTAASQTLESIFVNDVGPVLAVALRQTFFNLVSYFLNRVTYDAAVFLASGANGQQPLVETRSFDTYFKDLGLDVAGEAMASLNDVISETTNLDFDVCAPTDSIVRLNISVGLKSAYSKGAAPRCNIQDVLKNWDAFIGTMALNEATTQNILRSFADAYKPGQNEITAAIGLNLKVHQQVAEKKEEGKEEYFNPDRGFKNVVDMITGETKTPAGLIKKQTEANLIDLQNDKKLKEIDLVTQDKEAFLQIAVSAGSIFLNTLISNFANNIFSGLFDATPRVDPFNPGASIVAGRQAAQEMFRSILSVPIISFDSYNVLNEYVVCPGGEFRSQYNCTVDQSFVTAVGRANGGVTMTVQEAVDEGLLHGNWPLIPSRDEARNQSADCYNYGYCYGNLVKLRKARLLPIGWELAADSPWNNQSNPATLRTIMDDFFDCNALGEADSDHPWCHLIDPNWVLKLPPSQCNAFVPGELPVSGLVNIRQSTCVDSPSCIEQNAAGECIGGYGYCTKESNAWQFRGESCPAEYAGCLAFSNVRTGTNVDYLLNTVNTEGCTSENPGCRWYRTNRYFDNQGTEDPADDAFIFLPEGETYIVGNHDTIASTDLSSPTAYNYVDASGVPVTYANYAYEDRLYSNQNIGLCSESEAGCSELVSAEDVTLNLLRNPSFETDDDENGMPDGWLLTSLASATYDVLEGEAFRGLARMRSGASNEAQFSQTGVVLSPDRFYTFSFYAKDTANTTGTIELELASRNPSDTVDLSNRTILGDCDLSSSVDTVEIDTVDVGSEYERKACTFTTPSFDTFLTISVDVNSGGLSLDAFQLEMGSVATRFQEGYGGSSVTRSYLTLPPDYLGCTGAETDPAECGDYTQMCRAVDVGCELYTPLDGGFGVPAVVSPLDSCPNACVGYATYKQEATNYEAEQFPLFFIADTARTCAIENVGCDAYTNLDTVDAGGEGLEYYAGLRMCAKPEMDPGATYYTWEGTEDEGFQLRSWQLLASNLGDAPCTTPSVQSESRVVCQDTSSSVTSGCSAHADVLSNPDCREFYDAEGDIHYRFLSETAVISSECRPYRQNETSGATVSEQQANCQSSGGFWTAGSTCRYYVLGSESNSCPAEASGCREYTGASGRNASTIFQDVVEDGDVNEYASVGSAMSVSNESIAAGGHSIHVTSGSPRVLSLVEGGSGVTVTVAGTPTAGNQCGAGETCTLTDVNGSSCTVVGTASLNADDCGPLVGQLMAGKTYVLDFWAKGNGVSQVFPGGERGTVRLIPQLVDNRGNGTAHAFSAVTGGLPTVIDSDWSLYSVGPLDTSDLAFFGSFDDTATLRFTFMDGTADYYIDNIVLRETEENIALIKDSWVTPSTCDQSPTGAPVPQYYLGCRAYEDRAGDASSLYQFTRLCSEDVIGCRAYFDTQNSEAINGQTFNATCQVPVGSSLLSTETNAVTTATACQLDGTTVCTIRVGTTSCHFDYDGLLSVPLPNAYTPEPAQDDLEIVYGPETRIVSNDTDLFLVNQGNTSCNAVVAGCTEVGTPVYNQAKDEVVEFTSEYVIDDPDQYARTLCDTEGLFCEAWETTSDGTFYFKDPVDQTCEFVESVTIQNQKYSGWFRTGTQEPCDDAYFVNGTTFGIWRNGDPTYVGWAGTCPDQYDRCTEFNDPMDTSDGLYPNGTPYVYLNNEALSESSLVSSERCDGQVSLNAGCALFFNAVQPEMLWNATASYILSEHADLLSGDEPQALTTPLSCAGADPSTNDIGDILTSNGTVNLCAQRCAYAPTSGGVIDYAYVEEINDIFYTTSCLLNTDCSTLTDSENEPVQGTCVQSYEANPTGLIPTYDFRAPVLTEDDTNEVKKVIRDRQCSEWLSCASTQKVWDERTGRSKEICNQIAACDQYQKVGNNTVCVSFSNEPAQQLNLTRYVNRDVSWWGEEYSGYSIPGTIPTQYLDQVNINTPRWCNNSLNTGSHVPCTLENEETVCDVSIESCMVADPDYRLAFNAGVCAQSLAPGASCYVGTCSDSGFACATTADCGTGGGVCEIGQCETTLIGETCSLDNPCDLGQTCRGGFCRISSEDVCSPLTETANCGADTSEEDHQCVLDSTAFQGACYNSQCLLSTSGAPFSVALNAGNQNAQECRGYPEPNAPYPQAVVTQWKNPETEDSAIALTTDERGFPVNMSVDRQLIPYTKIPGFQGVNVCAPNGGDCLCTYDKVSYGEGIEIRYYSPDASVSDPPTGICSGGNLAGKTCEFDADCGALVGRCVKRTSVDTMLGLSGYCLERDTSFNKWGNSSNAYGGLCLTWLPVDQLTGARDIYNNVIGAGQLLDQNALYCTDVDLYMDLYPTGSVGHGTLTPSILDDNLACAESRRESDYNDPEDNLDMCQEGDEDGCARNAHCPYNYFAVLGACQTSNGVCNQGSNGDNDCPYFCVPSGAHDPSEANSEDAIARCDIPSGGSYSGSASAPTNIDSGAYTLDWSTTVYRVGSLDDSSGDYGTNWKDRYAGCVVQGVLHDDLDSFDTLDPRSLTSGSTSWNWGWRNVDQTGVVESYLACSEVALVSDVDGVTSMGSGNKAWTNRLWSDSEYLLSGLSDPNNFPYSASSAPEIPAGRVEGGLLLYQNDAFQIDPTLLISGNQYPIPVKSCYNSDSGDDYLYTPNLTDLACTPGDDVADYYPGGAPAALSYTHVTAYPSSLGPGFGSCSNSFACNDTVFTCTGGNSVCRVSCNPASSTACQFDTDDDGNDDLDLGDCVAPNGDVDEQFYCSDPNTILSGGDCSDDAYTVLQLSNQENTYLCEGGGPMDGLVCEEHNDCFSRYCFGGSCYDDSVQIGVSNVVVAEPELAFTERLGQFFTKLFGKFEFGGSQDGYIVSPSSDEDLSEDPDAIPGPDDAGNPAIIRSIGPCFTAGCQEGANGKFSVNGIDSGEIIGVEGAAHVSVQFFVEGDANQMPLRTVLVNWGDGRVPGGATGGGYYQNHRGLQTGSTTDAICGSNGNWGETSEACAPSSFTFTKDYVCNTQILNNGILPACGVGADESDGCNDNGVCVYVPRVYVKDNWGYCTGSCGTIDSPAGTLCYDNSSATSDAIDECQIECDADSDDSECNANLSYTNVNPWIYFDGEVRVEP